MEEPKQLQKQDYHLNIGCWNCLFLEQYRGTPICNFSGIINSLFIFDIDSPDYVSFLKLKQDFTVKPFGHCDEWKRNPNYD